MPAFVIGARPSPLPRVCEGAKGPGRRNPTSGPATRNKRAWRASEQVISTSSCTLAFSPPGRRRHTLMHTSYRYIHVSTGGWLPPASRRLGRRTIGSLHLGHVPTL